MINPRLLLGYLAILLIAGIVALWASSAESQTDEVERCVVYIGDQVFTPPTWDPACDPHVQDLLDEAIANNGGDPDITGLLATEMVNDTQVSGVRVEHLHTRVAEPAASELYDLALGNAYITGTYR